jgi:hypothetical protein
MIVRKKVKEGIKINGLYNNNYESCQPNIKQISTAHLQRLFEAS